MANLKDLKINNIPFLDLVYPIGSIYETSDGDFNPAEEFGGTWEKIEGRFLIGASDEYPNGTTGGSTTHSHDAGSLYACIGSPYGNANALGFTSTGWHGADSTYSVGGTTATASGHPSRSHDTDVGGTTGTSSSMPPYLAVYMWKRTE